MHPVCTNISLMYETGQGTFHDMILKRPKFKKLNIHVLSLMLSENNILHNIQTRNKNVHKPNITKNS